MENQNQDNHQQVNLTFDEATTNWIDDVASSYFHMTGWGSRPHVVRVCVELVRKHGLLDSKPNVPPSAVDPEQNSAVSDPPDHATQQDVTGTQAQNVPRGTN